MLTCQNNYYSTDVGQTWQLYNFCDQYGKVCYHFDSTYLDDNFKFAASDSFVIAGFQGATGTYMSVFKNDTWNLLPLGEMGLYLNDIPFTFLNIVGNKCIFSERSWIDNGYVHKIFKFNFGQ